MTRAALHFEVEDGAMVASLHAADAGVTRFASMLAASVAEDVRVEAGARSQRLGAPWPLEGAGSSWRVEAPEWWAQFLARGTRAHGPATAETLVFYMSDQGLVRPSFVAGIAADPFDERAVLHVQSRAAALLQTVIGGGA